MKVELEMTCAKVLLAAVEWNWATNTEYERQLSSCRIQLRDLLETVVTSKKSYVAARLAVFLLTNLDQAPYNDQIYERALSDLELPPACHEHGC
jgi:hypothetical protein